MLKMVEKDSEIIAFNDYFALRKMYPDTEFFLVRIFLHSDWIWRFTCIQSEHRKIRTGKNSVFGPFSRSVAVGFHLENSGFLVNRKTGRVIILGWGGCGVIYHHRLNRNHRGDYHNRLNRNSAKSFHQIFLCTSQPNRNFLKNSKQGNCEGALFNKVVGSTSVTYRKRIPPWLF